MNNKIKVSLFILALSLCLGNGLLHAAANAPKGKQDDDSKSPLGCRDVGYQFELKVLKLLPGGDEDSNSLYFIFNKGKEPIKLFQMRKEESTRSLYLNHTVQPNQWGVLSTSEKYIKYICAKEDPDSDFGDIVDCADSVKVCEYARVKFGLNNRGNLWLVESTDKNTAVRNVLNYGIIPR